MNDRQLFGMFAPDEFEPRVTMTPVSVAEPEPEEPNYLVPNVVLSALVVAFLAAIVWALTC